MASSSNQSLLRNGIVLRQVVLFIIFAAVLAGGIFEFGYSRPAFMSAWEKIEEIDSSANSSDYTAEKIEEMIGKQPVEVDTSQERVEVRVYSWPSGLPFRSHDIRVVYTKLSGLLAESNPELAGDRNYYSASGGTPLTSENFPAERPTMVYNFNKPSRAGGPPPGAPEDDSKSSPQLVIGDNEDSDKQPKNDDKKADEKKDKKSDPESADGDNKTPPESVEDPGKPGEAKEADKKGDESTPKGGEPGGEPKGEPGAEQPAENPDSGDKGEGNQEVPDGGEGAGGEESGG